MGSQKNVSLRIQLPKRPKLPKYPKKDAPLTLSSQMLSRSLRCVRDRALDILRVSFGLSIHFDVPASAAAAADIRQRLLQNTLSCMKKRFLPEPKVVLQAQHEKVFGEACGLPHCIFFTNAVKSDFARLQTRPRVCRHACLHEVS